MKWYKLLKAYDGHKAGETLQLSEDEASPLLKAGIIEETEEDPVKDAISGAVAGLKTQIAEAAKAAVAEAVAGLKLDDGNGKRPNFKVHDREEDDPLQGFGPTDAFERSTSPIEKQLILDHAFGQFAKDVHSVGSTRGNVRPERIVKYLARVEAKAPTGANIGTGEDGGHLIPDVMSNRIFELAFPAESWFGMTDQYTLEGNTMVFRSLREHSRADGYRHGGVLARWLDEGAVFTKTDKLAWDKSRFELSKLGVFLFATEEMLEDAPVLGQFLTRKAGEAMRFEVHDAMFNGDNVGKPLGIIDGDFAAMIATTRTLASHLKGEDILNVWTRFYGPSRTSAIWLYEQSAEKDLIKCYLPFLNVAGTENVGGTPLFMAPGDGVNAPAYARILGRPAYPCEFCKALGTKGDLILVDWSQYVTLVKSGGIRSAMSIHLRFDYDETAFRFTYRVDGGPSPTWSSALTPFSGGDTLSPFVCVAS